MQRPVDQPATNEAQFVRRLLARERLSIDEGTAGRTCFLSHLGAQRRLRPGAWIAHRELLGALAGAHLTHGQRTSLARAVAVDFDREFGVGRLRLTAIPSGLPFGGASLVLEPRLSSSRCLVAWRLGQDARPMSCDWLVLTGDPAWCCDGPLPVVRPKSLEVLVALGGEVVVLVDGITTARQVADHLRAQPLAAHPRFAPFLDGLTPTAPVVLWPYDALRSAGLQRRQPTAVVCVDAGASQQRSVEAWAGSRNGARNPEVSLVRSPGRIDRGGLCEFWKQCGRPKVLVRGDPEWARLGQAWLEQCGAAVLREGKGTQLGLFGG